MPLEYGDSRRRDERFAGEVYDSPEELQLQAGRGAPLKPTWEAYKYCRDCGGTGYDEQDGTKKYCDCLY